MPLYLVVNDDLDGENKDLFVQADTPLQAVKEQLRYYHDDEDYDDGNLKPGCDYSPLDAYDTDFRVFVVPMSTKNGPLEWPEPIIVKLADVKL